MGALRSEGEGCGATDAAGGASYDGYFVVKAAWHGGRSVFRSIISKAIVMNVVVLLRVPIVGVQF